MNIFNICLNRKTILEKAVNVNTENQSSGGGLHTSDNQLNVALIIGHRRSCSFNL